MSSTEESCDRCDDSGIVGVNAIGPITCTCQVGKNAKEANPDWHQKKQADANYPFQDCSSETC